MKEININATSVNTNIHDKSPIKEKHEGVRYEYDQCESKTKELPNKSY